MKDISPATRHVIETFQEKAANMSLENHPYNASIKARNALGESEWTDESKQSAAGALGMFTAGVVASGCSAVMNEIVTLMRIAHDSFDEEHKNAAHEMASSMTFLERVMGAYLNSIDFHLVGERLFDQGRKIEEEERRAEAAKAKVQKAGTAAQAATPAAGVVHRRRPEPSQN